MRAFAELLDRLSLTPSRNAKLTLVRDYLKETSDPDRGWALAALTGDLTFDAAKPTFIRKATEKRMGPRPSGGSYNFEATLAEAVWLVGPRPPGATASRTSPRWWRGSRPRPARRCSGASRPG